MSPTSTSRIFPCPATHAMLLEWKAGETTELIDATQVVLDTSRMMLSSGLQCIWVAAKNKKGRRKGCGGLGREYVVDRGHNGGAALPPAGHRDSAGGAKRALASYVHSMGTTIQGLRRTMFRPPRPVCCTQGKTRRSHITCNATRWNASCERSVVAPLVGARGFFWLPSSG